jgi:hypothetical protein
MIGMHTGRTPPPLRPDVDALLAYEREIPAQPEKVRTRAVARAQASLQRTDGAYLAIRFGASPGRRLVYALAAGIVLMAGAAAAYQALRQPEPAPARGMTTAPSRAPGALPAVAVPPDMKVPPEAAPALVPKPSMAGHRPGSVRNEAKLEELRLLVRARQADAHADYASVLGLLAEHERTYPTGRLAEEREVLRVKALVGLGRGGEARQVAAGFRRQFPRSVLLHKVDEMLASLR